MTPQPNPPCGKLRLCLLRPPPLFSSSLHPLCLPPHTHQASPWTPAEALPDAFVSVDVSDVFIFSAWGRRRGSRILPEVPGRGGGRLSLKIPGGVSLGEGVEGPGGCLWEFWGVGGLEFFFGAEIPTKS